MLIGVPTEIKPHEYRVGLTPACVKEICMQGHDVIVQSDAGNAIGLTNEHYKGAGARIVDVDTVFEQSDMVIKVKEPQSQECAKLKNDQILFTYLHLAADKLQTSLLAESGCTAIAYETVTDQNNQLPLLAPMSEVAGRMSIQTGAHCLEHVVGGRGVLLGGVPGVKPAKVVIIGGGIVGTSAMEMAVGMHAHVVVLDRDLKRLRELDSLMHGRIETIFSTTESLQEHVISADLVIGSVLLPGAAAPKLLSKELIKEMKPGSAIVDVAIDQGGCSENSKPTTHSDPTFIIDDVVHYCVANMPGAVAHTSTYALTNATLPYVLQIANKGWKSAMKEHVGLRNGLNVHAGKVTCEAVAKSLEFDYTSPDEVLDLPQLA